MGFDIPYGDPHEMHRLARELRHDAEQIESVVDPLRRALPDTNDFRGHVAQQFRARRDEILRKAWNQRDQLRDLASWLDDRANQLQGDIDDARRRAAEAEARRRQFFSSWPWGR